MLGSDEDSFSEMPQYFQKNSCLKRRLGKLGERGKKGNFTFFLIFFFPRLAPGVAGNLKMRR